MTRSLTFKLASAFMLVSLVGIIIVAILLRVVTPVQVSDLLEQRYHAELGRAYAQHYQATGSWEHAEKVYAAFGDPSAAPLILFDANRKVVTVNGRPVPRDRVELPQTFVNSTDNIIVDGEVVGYLISDSEYRNLINESRGNGRDSNAAPPERSGFAGGNFPVGPEPRPNAQEFTARFNLLLLTGGVMAVIFSVGASLILARTLTKPIRSLTEATKTLALGNLGQQVDVTSKDELGALADSFNSMSRQLQAAQDQRKQMTADIAHELRTPLSIIMGHTEALSDGVLAPTPERLAVIHQEALRLDHLIEDLRVLALSDAGELHLRRETVKPADIIQSTEKAFLPLAESKKVRISTTISDSLSDVVADPQRITQVMGNLTSNALRHTPAGGEIRLLAEKREGNFVRFEIQDSGTGVAEEDLPNLFERFYRADRSRNRNIGGSGLGLAIARSIVEAHGGQIDVTNRTDGGAVFGFTLPTVLSV